MSGGNEYNVRTLSVFSVGNRRRAYIPGEGTALPTVGRLFLQFLRADATKFEYANEVCDRCNEVTVCASWSARSSAF